MAVATTTLIAGIGLAITAGTTAASFAQAAKQRKLMTQAEIDAEKLYAEAQKKLDVNYIDPLAIQQEPYERMRESLLSSGAQAIQAGVESGRGAPATAGRVQMAMNEGQADIRAAQGDELSNLAKLSATEDSRLRDVKAQLDLSSAEGAQEKARDAQQAAAAATTAGMAGLTSLASQGIDMAPLYGQNLAAQQDVLSNVKLSQAEQDKFNAATLNGPPTPAGLGSPVDFSNVKSMTKTEYRDFLKNLSPQQKQMLFSNPQYLEGMSTINPFAI